MDAVIAAFIAWIVAKTGLLAPPPPRILFVPKAELVQMLYGPQGGKNIIHVDALYAHDQDTVYLAEGWNAEDVAQRGRLLHELVHHVQRFNKIAVPCLAAYERQAYQLHLAWLREQGVEDPYLLLDINELTISLVSRCPWELE